MSPHLLCTQAMHAGCGTTENGGDPMSPAIDLSVCLCRVASRQLAQLQAQAQGMRNKQPAQGEGAPAREVRPDAHASRQHCCFGGLHELLQAAESPMQLHGRAF